MGKMPSDLKQKNKKFKGNSKKTKFEKKKSKPNKRGKKEENKLSRKNKKKQLKLNKVQNKDFDFLNKNIILKSEYINQYKLLKKQNKELRIILIVGMNCDFNNNDIMQLFSNFIDSKTENKNNILLENNEIKLNNHILVQPKLSSLNQFKNSDNLLFINCPRNLSVVMDFLKIADIILMVSSTQNVNLKESNINPVKNCNAFDNFGLEFITKLRTFGQLATIALIPDLFKIDINKQKEVKFYFKRFYNDEFNKNIKIKFLKFNDGVFNENDLIKLFMEFININLNIPMWRNNRGYLYVEKIKKNEFNQIEMKGFVKGNGFTTFEYLHLTNYGILKPKKVIILSNENNLNQEKIFDFEYFEENQEQIIKEEDENINDKYFENLNENFGNLNINEEKEKDEMVEEEDDSLNENDESDISFDDFLKKEENIKKNKELQLIKRDEKEFEDEVDYNPNEILREKFREYKYIKDFKRTNWNIYDNIPEDDFKKIKILNNPKISQKNSELLHLKNLKILNGIFVKFIFEDVNLENFLNNFDRNYPLILSNLFRHEESKTLMNIKCKLHNESENFVESFKNYKIIMGFQNWISNLTFSKIIKNTKKTKLVDKIDNYDDFYLASFYGNLYFPYKNCLILNMNNDNLLLNGSLEVSNPFHVILKRIIWTGYPLKIKKKNAVIRYMFFNEDDIKFYQMNEVYTKKGLRGKIKESLGTHGLMKVQFSGAPKHGDTICMALYKRIFPIMSLN